MMRTLDIPISPDRLVALQVPFGGLTEQEWTAMLSVLAAMKGSLVVERPQHTSVSS